MPFKEWPPSLLVHLSKSQFPEPGKEPPFLRGDTPFTMLMIQNDCLGLKHQWQEGICTEKQNSSGFSRLPERMQLGRPWLPLSLAGTKPGAGLGFD